MKLQTVIVREYYEKMPRPFLTDKQLRLELSKEKCKETHGAVMLGEHCPECRFFLFLYPNSTVACEFCKADREWAQEGRTLLTKARLAEKGIFVDDLHATLHVIEPESSDWPLIGGMSL